MGILPSILRYKLHTKLIYLIVQGHFEKYLRLLNHLTRDLIETKKNGPMKSILYSQERNTRRENKDYWDYNNGRDKVLNYESHHVMLLQYCDCGHHRSRNYDVISIYVKWLQHSRNWLQRVQYQVTKKIKIKIKIHTATTAMHVLCNILISV